jgi:hypothetical protein
MSAFALLANTCLQRRRELPLWLRVAGGLLARRLLGGERTLDLPADKMMSGYSCAMMDDADEGGSACTRV